MLNKSDRVRVAVGPQRGGSTGVRIRPRFRRPSNLASADQSAVDAGRATDLPGQRSRFLNGVRIRTDDHLNICFAMATLVRWSHSIRRIDRMDVAAGSEAMRRGVQILRSPRLGLSTRLFLIASSANRARRQPGALHGRVVG